MTNIGDSRRLSFLTKEAGRNVRLVAKSLRAWPVTYQVTNQALLHKLCHISLASRAAFNALNYVRVFLNKALPVLQPLDHNKL